MPSPETNERRLRASDSSSEIPRLIARLISEKPVIPSIRVAVQEIVSRTITSMSHSL
jgi:hypothetical protein